MGGGKSCSTHLFDTMLGIIANKSSFLCVCGSCLTSTMAWNTAASSGSTECIIEYVLGDSDDFGIANGDANGRKITSTSISTDAHCTAVAATIALVSETTQAILFVTTCTTQAVTEGNTVTVPEWDIEISDPT